MIIPLHHYKQKGWQHIEGYLTEDEVNTVKQIGEQMRMNASKYSDWKGIPCASKFDKTLFSLYTSEKMKELSSKILGDIVYLFNDQIVIKLPNENFEFEAHRDNQYGPNSDGSIHTVNICWILDDFTMENGGLDVKNQDNSRWVKLYPKKGDVVAIQGNTYHRSGRNMTNKSRGLYACVYTEQPIHLDGFYTEQFK
jgi:hypothetical protein